MRAAFSAMILALTLAPYLAAIVLGAAALPHSLGDPGFVAAWLRGLLLAEGAVAIGWPCGVAAALALWNAPPGPRRLVLGASLLTLLMPQHLPARGLAMLADHLALPWVRLACLLAAHAATAAALVLLIVTAALNRLDPAMLRSATLAGASLWQARRLVLLPPLAVWLAGAAAAAFAMSLGQAAFDGLLAPSHQMTLAGMVFMAWNRADVLLAPALLALAMMALAPVLVVLLMM